MIAVQVKPLRGILFGDLQEVSMSGSELLLRAQNQTFKLDLSKERHFGVVSSTSLKYKLKTVMITE